MARSVRSNLKSSINFSHTEFSGWDLSDRNKLADPDRAGSTVLLAVDGNEDTEFKVIFIVSSSFDRIQGKPRISSKREP